MRATANDWFDEVRGPLAEWCEAHAPALAPPMFVATTFYEAFRASQSVSWRRPLDQFSALHTWATCALVIDDRTRPYMKKLITDKQSGFEWTLSCGHAIKDVMTELARERRRDRTRAFKQHRKGAIKALHEARTHVAALVDDPLELEALLGDPSVRKFKDAVTEFVQTQRQQRWARGALARKEALQAGKDTEEAGTCGLMAAMTTPPGERVPDADFLLKAMAASIEVLPTPKADRHNARAKYLRALFDSLAYSAVRQRRVAFLTHAAAAVFGEHVEKRDIRRLVKDLVAVERERAQLAALFDAGDEQALLEYVSLHFGR